MGPRLSEAAVSGMSSALPTPLTTEQIQLLTEGDIEGLFEFHSSVFGSATMRDEDEDDEDDEDEDDDSDDDDQEDDADEDDEDDDEDEDDEKDDKGRSKRKPKIDPKDSKIKDLSAEAKRYRLKNRTHRQRIAELEAENAKLKGKSTSDDEDDKSKAKQTTKDNGPSARERELQIQVAFTTDRSFVWKDPKAALKLLDTSDVDIDDEGDVEGLEDAIKQLAEQYPFLLAETPDEKTKRKGEQRRRSQGRTGQSTSTRKKASTDQKKLIDAYNIQR